MSDLNDFVSMMLRANNRFKIEPDHKFDKYPPDSRAYCKTTGTAVIIGPEAESKTIAYFDTQGVFVRFGP